MKFLKIYIRFAEKIVEKTGKFISYLTTLLVLTVCYDVFTRYFLKKSSVAVQELEWHLFAVIFLMGAAYTLKTENHVRVDVFYSKFTDKGKAWVNFLGSIIFLIPFCVLIIYASENFVLNSFRISETSPDPGGLPGRYVLKAVIPVSFFLLLIQSCSLLFKSILTIFNKEN